VCFVVFEDEDENEEEENPCLSVSIRG